MSRKMDEQSYNEKRIDGDINDKQDALRELKNNIHRFELETTELRSRRDQELKENERLNQEGSSL